MKVGRGCGHNWVWKVIELYNSMKISRDPLQPMDLMSVLFIAGALTVYRRVDVLDDRALFSDQVHHIPSLLQYPSSYLSSGTSAAILSELLPFISWYFFLFSIITYGDDPCDIPSIYLIPCDPDLHGSNKSPLCGLLLNFVLSFNTGLTRTMAKNGKPLYFRPLWLYFPDHISCSVTQEQPNIAW